MFKKILFNKSQSNDSKIDRSNSRSNSRESSKKLSCSDSGTHRKPPLNSSSDTGGGGGGSGGGGRQSRHRIQHDVKEKDKDKESGSNNGNSTAPVVDTGVQTQTEDLEETNYVKELKNQLEILKNEITRLQNAQSNLEKSLKQTTTAFRPFMYTGGFSDQGELIADFNIENYLTLDPSTFGQLGSQKALTAASATSVTNKTATMQSSSTSIGGSKDPNTTALCNLVSSSSSPNNNNNNNNNNSATVGASSTVFVDPNSLLLQQPFITYDTSNLKEQLMNENIFNLNQFNVIFKLYSFSHCPKF